MKVSRYLAALGLVALLFSFSTTKFPEKHPDENLPSLEMKPKGEEKITYSREVTSVESNSNTIVNWAESSILQILDSDTQLMPDGSGWKETQIVETKNNPRWLRIENQYVWDEEIEDYKLTVHKPAVADEILVKLENQEQIQLAYEAGEERYFEIVERLTNSGWFRVKLGNFKTVSDLPKALRFFRKEAAETILAEPDYLVRQTDILPNDPLFLRQVYLKSNSGIDAIAGWEIQSDATGIQVAIIDSGIWASHEDLRDNLWSNPDEIQDGIDNDANGYVDDIYGIDVLNNSGNPTDESGHGTQVSGLIGAAGNNGIGISGVAWKTDMMALRFLNEIGQGTTSDAIKCIQYSIDKEADIINLSWGGSGRSQALEDLLLECNSKGILCVTSAGNSAVNIDSNPTYPASYQLPNLITVAASDDFLHRTNFSNWGPNSVQIIAPGNRLQSTYLGTDSSYTEFTGTSAAAPLVSGIAALARAKFGNEPAETLRNRILQGARLSNTLGGVVSTGGIADLYRVLSEQTNAPLNDDFEDALQLNDSIYRIQSTLEFATTQIEEPNPKGLQNPKSLWYSLRYAQPADIGIQATAGNFDPQINVYTGSELETLELQETDNSPANTSELRFKAAKDVLYYIQVLGPSAAGLFDLNLFTTPGNDDFRSADVVSGNIFSVSGNNLHATQEIGDPNLFDRSIGNSLWWEYTPEATGTFYLTSFGSETDTLLGVFKGNSLQGLELVISNDDQSDGLFTSAVSFEVQAGSTYFILIDSGYPPGGPITLTGQFQNSPVFLQTPESQTAELGTQVIFSGLASGPEPLVYQWKRNGSNLPLQNGSDLQIDSVAEKDYGKYQLEVSSPGGTILSSEVLLSRPVATPKILIQPEPVYLQEEGTETLTILTSEPASVTYTWFRNFERIPGINTNEIDVSYGGFGPGLYYAEISYPGGTTRSNPVRVSPQYPENVLGVPLSTRGIHGFVNALEYYKGRFFGAGSNGMYVVSEDGFTWQPPKYIPNRLSVISSVLGNGLLLAVQINGVLSVTDDFENWESVQPSPSLNRNVEVVFGDGKFMMRGAQGRVLGSEDGISWKTYLDLGADADLRSVSAAAGIFLVVEVINGHLRMHRSENGTDWEFQDYPELQAMSYSMAVGGIDFFLLSADKRYYSVDGENWILQEGSPYPGDTRKIIKAENIYYAATKQNDYLSSTDGLIWETRLSHKWPSPRDVGFTYGAGIFLVAPGEVRHEALPGEGSIFPVKDFDDFIDPDPGSIISGYNLSYIEGKFVTVYDSSIWTSPTGSNWTKHEFASQYVNGLSGIAYGNGVYTLGSASGPSLDLLSFRDIGNSQRLKPLAFGKGIFVAISNEGIETSTDGTHWETVSLANSRSVRDIVFEGGQFIAVGHDGTVGFSSDGNIWMQGNVAANSQFFQPDFISVAYGNGKYVSPVEEILISGMYQSEDGVNWTWIPIDFEPFNLEPENPLKFGDITFWKNRFYVSCGNFVLHSQDLVEWSAEKTAYYANSFAPTEEALFVMGGGFFRIGDALGHPPYIAFENPGQVISESNKTLSFETQASDVDGSIAKISFYVDGNLVKEDVDSPYTFTWTIPDWGSYAIKATATDDTGMSSSVTKIVSATRNSSIPLQLGDQHVSFNNTASFNDANYLLGESGILYRSDESENWLTAYQFPTADLYSLQRFRDVLVANARGGVYYSTNGINWNYVDLPNKNDFSSLVDLGDAIATGYDPSRDYFSLDGHSWQRLSDFSNPQIYELTGSYNLTLIAKSSEQKQYFVRTGNGEWQNRILPGGHFLAGSIQVEDELIIWVEDSESNSLKVFRTDNLVDWQEIQLPWLTTFSLTAFYSNGVLAINGSDKGAYSVDLENWHTLPPSAKPTDITWKYNRYYLATDGGLMTSDDGLAWNFVPDTFASSGTFVEVGESLYLVHYFGSWKTVDGVNWISEERGNDNSFETEFRSITFGSAGYIGLTTSQMARSQDGLTWEFEEKPMNVRNSIAFGNGVYVAPATNKELAVSSNGIDWDYVAHTFDNSYWFPESIHFLEDPGLFILDNGEFYFSSPDGLNWTARNYGDYRGELKKAGKLVHGLKKNPKGIGGPITVVSKNGINWTEHPDMTGSIFYHNGIYLGAGISSEIPLLKSTDGISWTAVETPVTGPARPQHIDNNGFYVAFGDPYFDKFFFTEDGESWIELPPFEWVGNVFHVNDKIFYSQPRLQLASDEDLRLTQIEVSGGNYGIGDSIDVVLRISNLGGRETNLKNIELWSTLVGRDEWDGNPQNELTPVILGEQIIAAEETIEIPIAIEIQKGTEPGIYGLQAWLNPTQVIAETTAQNNYAWTEGLLIEIPEVSLTLSTVNGGSVIPIPAKLDYALGDTASLVARALPKFRLLSWEGVDSASAETASLLMDSNKTAGANFERIYYPDIEIAGGGKVYIQPDQFYFSYGETVSLSAVAEEGWTFNGWAGPLTGNNLLGSFEISSDVIVSARFARSIQAWKASTFSAEQLTDQTIAASSADPDLDGYINAMEYFFGTNPLEITEYPRFSLSLNGEIFSISLEQSPTALGFDLLVEATSDFEHWDSVTYSQIEIGSSTSTIISELKIEYSNQPKQFYRLKLAESQN